MNQREPSVLDGLFAWFACNHVAANLLMLLLLVGGLVSSLNMPVEIFPDIDNRVILINVPYPGSTPYEVEELINRRVEQAINGIEGIKRITSTASEGIGAVIAQLEDFANDREVLDDITAAVEQIQDFPPEGAEDEQITDSSEKQFVINVAIFGSVPEKTLRELAFRVRDDLTAIDGISIANVLGDRNYEIGIEVSETSLRKYNLSFDQIAQSVRDFSINLPGGTIRTDNQEILLRTDHQAYNKSDFEKIPVRTDIDGQVLKLKDVAIVNDGFTVGEQVNLFNGKPAVFVDVLKTGDQQVLDIENSVKNYVSNLSLPHGVEAVTWSNQATDLRGRIDLLIRNGLMGLILVFAVLVLFLNLKLAFWTTMGIPISFIGSFIIISFAGGSINMISLFAFIVVLGIVVDDAIIVGESIYTKREQGEAPMIAALGGLKEVVSPVTIGILTTIFAFLPMFFTKGIMGQFLFVIPLVVVSVLFLSLVEACLILPSHLSDIEKKDTSSAFHWIQFKFRNLLNKIVIKIYLPLLNHALNVPYIVIALALASLMIVVGAINSGAVKTVFFPDIDGNEITAKVRLPNGVPTSETKAVIKHIVSMTEQVRQEFDKRVNREGESIIVNVSAHVGSTPIATRDDLTEKDDSASVSHIGEVRVELLPGQNRPFSTAEIKSRWRELVGEIPGASIRYISDLIGAGEDINIELSHENDVQLVDAANSLQSILSSIEGVNEVEDSFELGKRELHFELTKTGLASGLTTGSLARQVRQAYFGEQAQRVQRGRDDIEVFVRYSDRERKFINSIDDMRIRLADGTELPLKTVAKIEETRGFSSIERANLRRIVAVTANVDSDKANANEVNRQLEADILPALKSNYPGLQYSFEGEQKEQQESVGSLTKGLFIAVLGIFSLLAVQLKSYTQPLIIMSVIPIGFIGAVIGHILLGFPVSFMSFFGIVALSGVVINDSLILMDLINRLRADGLELGESIRSAAVTRFRPIMFTTLTTCAGLTPIILEKSVQAQFLIPMAISLAFGVLFATLVTLLLVPSMYVMHHHVSSIKLFG